MEIFRCGLQNERRANELKKTDSKNVLVFIYYLQQRVVLVGGFITLVRYGRL